MQDLSKILIGKKVIEISILKDVFGISLEGKCYLNIYHPIIFSKNIDFRTMIGMKLVSFETKEEQIEISFEDVNLIIKKNWEYGPEIMQLNTPDYPFIIWNE